MASPLGLRYERDMRWRSFVWLLAFVALVFPPLAGPSAGMTASAQESATGCDHHAPPPPCPEKGSAKHAAGVCCPLMAQVVATLTSMVETTGFPTGGRTALPATVHFAGLSPHKDPPPPRV